MAPSHETLSSSLQRFGLFWYPGGLVLVLAFVFSFTAAWAEYLPQLEALGGENSAGAADLITYEISNTAVARPVTVGYVQFESLINKAFADIRNGADVTERLAQAQTQIEDAWSQLR